MKEEKSEKGRGGGRGGRGVEGGKCSIKQERRNFKDCVDRNVI